MADPVAPLLVTVDLDIGETAELTVTNLVINAAQALSGKGRIDVEVRAETAAIAITVTDDGPGIPADVLPRIFEPLFTTKDTGYGLGLASCREIVEHIHGGEISCESTPGSGTTFVVKLPKSRAA